MKVVISRRAEGDLARIYAYLAMRHGIEAAEPFKRRAEEALAQLARHPRIGPHPGWATRHKALRFWIISRSHYVIYCEPGAETVSVERVLDGRRDVTRIMEQGREEPLEPEEG